jgi:hypothetical protein
VGLRAVAVRVRLRPVRRAERLPAAYLPAGLVQRGHPAGEDAVRDGLVRIQNGGVMKSSRIVLTARGRARLCQNKI